MEIIILAFLTCASIIILLVKIIGWSKTLKWHRWIDVICTVGLTTLFMGTFSGMATAILAGVMLSLFLAIVNRAKDIGRV